MMRPDTSSSPRSRRILQAGLLTAVATLLVAGAASARIRTCRKDPVVVLSNGQVVRMTAVIGAPDEDVAFIAYTLQAPTGTTIEQIAYSGGPAAAQKEAVYFYPTLPAGQFSTTTVVYTTGAAADVTAITGVGGVSGEVQGWQQQPLVVNLVTPIPPDRGGDAGGKEEDGGKNKSDGHGKGHGPGKDGGNGKGKG